MHRAAATSVVPKTLRNCVPSGCLLAASGNSCRRPLATAGTVAVASSCSSSPLLSLVSSSSLLSPSAALLTPARGAGTYPSPGRQQQRRRAAKKRFNYLTGERLVSNKRAASESPRAIRARDDENLRRRKAYRAELLTHVENDIRFLTPVVKQHIFFGTDKLARRLFRGARTLAPEILAHCLCHVLHELCHARNRELLVQAMAAAKVDPPSARAWSQFCGGRNGSGSGSVTVGVYYSPWVLSQLRTIEERCARGGLSSGCKNITTLLRVAERAYCLQHAQDTARLPSMHSWWVTQPPITEKALRQSRSGKSSSLALRAERAALTLALQDYGRETVAAALRDMLPEEQAALVRRTERRTEALLEDMREHMLFASKVLLAAATLDDVRALMSPRRLFQFTREWRLVHDRGGRLYPAAPASSAAEWARLRPEERAVYSVFGMTADVYTASPQHLFHSYCINDYGLSRQEASRRWGRLSDVQSAALHFPFYYPIRPKSTNTIAFARFYREQCARFGLLRGSRGTFGNRVFEAAMRRQWRRLSGAERARYEDTEAIRAVFPLQPPTSSSSSAADGGGEEGEGGWGDSDDDEHHAEEEEDEDEEAEGDVWAGRGGREKKEKEDARERDSTDEDGDGDNDIEDVIRAAVAEALKASPRPTATSKSLAAITKARTNSSRTNKPAKTNSKGVKKDKAGSRKGKKKQTPKQSGRMRRVLVV